MVSLVWPDRGRGLRAFDDLAVQHARREVMRSAFPPDAVSTLVVDDSQFAGAITVRRGPGVVGTLLLPAGPVIERHGSAQPWPWAGF